MISTNLTNDELKKVFKHAKYGLIYELMYNLALRYSELKCLDYDTIVNDKCVYIIANKKGNNQVVDISDSLVTKVKQISKQHFNKIRSVTKSTLNNNLKKCLKRSTGVSSHSLRKSHANAVYKGSKFDIMAVKKTLRHKSLDSTQHYLTTIIDTKQIQSYLAL